MWQELTKAAEHLRQDEVRIPVLKSVIWEQLQKIVNENGWMQTLEVPTNMAAASSTKSKKSKDWAPSATWQAVLAENPGMEEERVEAEIYVDEHCIPLSQFGDYENTILCYQRHAWTSDMQDRLSGM